MTRETPKKGLKSVSGTAGLRSRGFLSQPGGRPAQDSADGDVAGTSALNRSRGSRQASASAGGKPEYLTPKPAIRPYTLEDE